MTLPGGDADKWTVKRPCVSGVERVAVGFVGLTLPKAEWTHAAHFAAALWMVLRHEGEPAEQCMPHMIRRYNESVGGVNDDHSGYHETITQASIRAVRAFVAKADRSEPLDDLHVALMAGPVGNKDWLLAYWSRERLFSVEARREWVEPDLGALPF